MVSPLAPSAMTIESTARKTPTDSRIPTVIQEQKQNEESFFMVS